MAIAFVRPVSLGCLAAWAAFAPAPRARADDNPIYDVTKTALYVQTSAAGAVPSSKYPYNFTAQAPIAATVGVPGGPSVTLPASDGGDFEYFEAFTAKTGAGGMDAAYPDGTYTMTGTGIPTLSLPLSPDSYPAAIPAVSGGTWANGVYVIDPASAATINFSAFSTYDSAGVGGYMGLDISPLSNGGSSLKQNQVTLSNPLGITQSATPFQSYTIPAGTLTAGNVYEATLDFGTALHFDTASVPGTAAVSLFENELVFYIAATSGTPPSPPVIATDLTNQSGGLGGTATFTAMVTTGGSPISGGYVAEWYFNGAQINLDGVKYISNGTSLQITDLTDADAGVYFAKFINTGGLAVSASATLTVSAIAAPTITTQPSAQSINSGATIVFTTAATGTDLAYQWEYSGNGGSSWTNLSNGNGISGATDAQLVIQSATGARAGEYACVVSNPGGSLETTPAALTVVTSSNPGRLVNLSVLSLAGSGSQLLTVGFVSGGSGTQGMQPLLLRAIGPSLAQFNVTGWMPDPELQLFTSTPTLVASNTGWASTLANQTAVTAADSATFAFALNNTASADSALVQTLNPGGYSAQVSSVSGTAGQVLAEIYDDTAAYTVTSPRLVNLSSSVQVVKGGTLTAGFVVGGNSAETVLVRASGPALTAFGVSNVMPDPQIVLYNQQQQPLASNAGWGGDPAVSAAASAVYAFAFTDPTSKDSALLLTLPPGNYSAAATSVSGSGGEVLIEVYEVP